MFKKILFSILILLSASIAQAATYTVSTTGNDSNPGTVGSPFLTIQKGVDTATSPGDTVCVNDGTYTRAFTKFGNPGTENNPITIRNCQGGTVLIDLGIHETSWTSLGGNKWEADNLAYTERSFKNKTWLGLPQASCADLDVQGEWCSSTHTRLEVYSTTNPALDDYVIGGYLWDGTNGDIADSGVRISNTSWVVIDGIDVGYGIFNYYIGYDSSGQAGPMSHITIKNAEVFDADSRLIRTIGSAIYQSSYMVLDNLVVHDTSTNTSGNGHCIKFDTPASSPINSHVVVSNSEIYNCRAHGIQFSTGDYDGEFYGNTIYNVGITVGSPVGQSAAIRCGAANGCDIHDNDLSGGLGSGIYVQEATTDVKIYNNRIHDFSWHGILVFGVASAPADAQIYNNLIYNNAISGMRFYNAGGEGSIPIEIYNNTFYNNGGPQISLLDAAPDLMNLIIRDNIVASTGTALAFGYVDAASFTEDHNLFWNSTTDVVGNNGVLTNVAGYQSLTSQGTGTLQQDPLFINATTDFHVQAGSPAIDSGANLSFSGDYDGNFRPQGIAWDLGAYEFGNPFRGIQGGAKLMNGAVMGQ